MSNVRPSLTLRNAQLITTADVYQFAWSGLRSFQNVSFVVDLLRDFHRLTQSQAANLRKQAQQIRDCLIQAREYSDASKVVSLATRPVLAYYSAMNLALAEILFKQTGESSLDRAREQHRHHGLVMPAPKKRKPNERLAEAAASLRAKAAISGTSRIGTFELWHRSARAAPLCGVTRDVFEFSGSFTSFAALLGEEDGRMPALSAAGINFFDIICALPQMTTFLTAKGIQSHFSRVEVAAEHFRENGRRTTAFTVQPTYSPVLEKVLDAIRVEPRGVEHLYLQDFSTGVRITYEFFPDFTFVVEFPSGATISGDLTIAWPEVPALNEFGFFYVGLFLSGMYSRYYPDYWMADVDAAHPLALAVEEFVHQADSRVPLLTLSELRRTYLVPER